MDSDQEKETLSILTDEEKVNNIKQKLLKKGYNETTVADITVLEDFSIIVNGKRMKK